MGRLRAAKRHRRLSEALGPTEKPAERVSARYSQRRKPDAEMATSSEGAPRQSRKVEGETSFCQIEFPKEAQESFSFIFAFGSIEVESLRGLHRSLNILFCKYLIWKGKKASEAGPFFQGLFITFIT